MTFLKKCTAPTLLFLGSFFIVAAQSAKEGSEILFTVNKTPVTTDEFVYLYRKNHQHKPEDFTKEKIQDYLNLFVNYKLKVEEAISRGMDTTETFRKEFQTYRNELLKPYMPDSKVVDSLVRLTYDRLKEEVNASHILIRLNEDASPEDTLKAYQQISELRRRALAGEDFGMLAAQHSEEPGVETTKGNLGYFTALQMVFPFEQAAYLTPVGQVSQPVRTQFGYHIVKVHDRQPSRGEVEVSHIMIRTQEGSDDVEARDRIFDVYDQLQKGVSWEELCQQYSEDPASKNQGGKLRPFGVGAMASVPEFQEMAFSLKEKGDISDPVQTQFGWHILKLESKIPLPPFEELKPSLTQRVSRDDRVRISKEALRERMLREFNYTLNGQVKTALQQRVDNIAGKDAGASASWQNEVLFTMQNKPYRVSDFLTFAKEEAATTNNALSPENFEQVYTQYIDKVQMELLEQRVKRESPDYKWLLKEYYEGILLFEIMEREVWNKAMEDSVGQRKYFEQHRGKYNADERMVGKVFATSVRSHMEQLKRLIENDEQTDEFLTANRIRQDSGAFEKKDRIIFSNIPWSTGVYTVEHNGVNYVIDIDKIIPPGPQTFDEARASVVSDYQSFLEDSWITELKRKFEVKVEKKAKKRVFTRLVDNKG
jgi:peptidyl-prolyl cis-trans isomerase SurA